MIALDFIAKLGIFGVLRVQELRSRPHHEQLSDLLLDGHLAKSFFCPLFAVTVEMHGYRLVFSFGNGGNGSEEKKQEKHAANHEGELTTAVSILRRLLGAAALSICERIILFPPLANAAVHRDHIGVTHLLQIIGCKG